MGRLGVLLVAKFALLAAGGATADDYVSEDLPPNNLIIETANATRACVNWNSPSRRIERITEVAAIFQKHDSEYQVAYRYLHRDGNIHAGGMSPGRGVHITLVRSVGNRWGMMCEASSSSDFTFIQH